MFENDCKPYLISPWIFRNDGEYGIVFKSVVEKDIYTHLTSLESLLLPLFNKELTLAAIRTHAHTIAQTLTGSQNVETIVNSTIDHLLNSGFISNKGPLSPSVNNGFEFIAPEAYTIPEGRLSLPLSVKIAFSNRCMYNCRYCYAEKSICQEVSTKKWIQLFDELKSNQISLVDIAGADIFSRSDALELLKEMTSRDFVFFLSTKSYIDDFTARTLSLYRIGIRAEEHLRRYFQLSIDSIDEKVNMFLLGTENHLENMSKSVCNLLKYGIEPRIKGVITPFNVYHIKPLIEIFSRLGVNTFQFIPYSRSIYRHYDSMFLQKKHITYLNQLQDEIRDCFPHLTVDIPVKQSITGKRNLTWKEWNNRVVCSGGRSNMVIQPDGDVILCDQIPHTKEYVVGNVFTDGVAGVWNSERTRSFLYPNKDKFKDTVCHECDEFNDCHKYKGYCYRDVYSSFNTIYDAQPECPLQIKKPLRES